ncbi:DEAD/DEAH box helicase [Psychrobium sp. 1_MG-2023]|uniref:DEAD/DEAH box helicase n=1 Tax=Psychrobium sp. 1_MG-2023 TaxID=3062624 RepID=UPI000C34668A|nr:DEAD/DEAH box helicase [Psychrobium sp. 1_MG-2023]MDP2562922.1 DEAD/DEAH box helicase [Psychrobium sp. 1_MG-2023]PKF54710.1 helicase [Alteromonadales bacterium alter-6D02]
MITKINLQIAQAIEGYQQCEPFEQAILRILAMVNKKIGQTKFKEVLAEVCFTEQFYQQKLKTKFTPELKKELTDKGLLDVSVEGLSISPYLANYLTELCVADESFEDILFAAEAVVPVLQINYWQKPDPRDTRRIIRDCFFRQEYQHCQELLAFDKNPQIVDADHGQLLVSLCFYPYQPEVFSRLPPLMQYQAFAALFDIMRHQFVDGVEVIELLNDVSQQQPNNHELRYLLAEQYLYRGELLKVKQLVGDNEKTTYGLQVYASYLFLSNQPAKACSVFKKAIVAKNKIARRKRQYIGGLLGLFYNLALIVEGSAADPAQLAVARAEIGNTCNDRDCATELILAYKKLGDLVEVLSGKSAYSITHNISFSHFTDYYSRLSIVICCLSGVWAKERLNTHYAKQLCEAFEHFSDMGDNTIAVMAAHVIKFHDVPLGLVNQFIVEHEHLTDPCLLVQRQEAWAQALEQLIALDETASKPSIPKPSTQEKQSRLVWLLDDEWGDVSFEAKEQKMGKSGWSKGRTVALKRLKESPEQFDFLTADDLTMCRAIYSGHSGGYYGKEYYTLGGVKAAKAAVGLDNIYHQDNLGQAISFVEVEPELAVTQSHDGYLLTIANLPKNTARADSTFSLTKISSQQYQLCVFSAKHLEIADIVGEGGLMVPRQAKDKVVQSIAAIAPLLNIQTDIENINTGTEQITADPHLYMMIQPAGQGLEFECHVQPLGPDGPLMSPGFGNPSFSMEINGERIGTTRDLAAEQYQLQYLERACPIFAQMIDNRLLLSELDDSLMALEQLELACGIGDERVPTHPELKLILTWPKGKDFKLTKRLESKHLQLKVKKQNEWFSLEGELEVNDNHVIELKQLLALIGQQKGRFVTLDDNQVLSLSDELRQRLQTLETVTQEGKFHVLASPVVDTATQGMRFKTLHAWEKQKGLLQQANELNPQVPSTLQAQLRDYQLEGYDWASRLAHWGAGACLADDMGLGKTMQALAIILSRGSDGPSLVLAPTSVCFNWQQEVARFAPTLRAKILGVDTNTMEQRQELVDNAGAFDLIICSYGLLQRESERLSQVKWNTIVADEAQALKNPLAKRTQAAVALSGAFKMITTGTPIENNLTELWSLFRFINPGLLGSQKQFFKRFASEIENANNTNVAKQRANVALRQLISPFILRRMKNQVLTELPSRTEINLAVELSEEESALYEAVRQQALENLTQSGMENDSQQHIKMLAEIMKLRRACCHPALVAPETGIEGSKLKAFDNLIGELKQNNHKALVFSQFVGHLDILRKHLDNKGISYQYLDGGTPAKQRQSRVNAFQAGDGDVFLISLKAGGSGLNLTAADYVIHMDPWWNPAVEDQASDRAHRMGQTRPVTIYRLIAKGTIEDKILAMHQSKRDLADSLLSGNETAQKISAQDMMDLLQEQL